MKNDTIRTRKWITTCLMALFTFCLVLTGIFFIAPIEAEAATLPSIYFDSEDEYYAYYGYEPLTESTYELTADRTIDNTYYGYIIPSGKNVTINGKGHTIYITDDDAGGNNRDMTLFKVSSSATLTLNNVNIVVRKLVGDGTYNDYASIIDTDLYSVVNVNNCTIDGSENELTRGYIADIAPTATFTATSTTFKGWVTYYRASNNNSAINNSGLLTLKDCTFDNSESKYFDSANAYYDLPTVAAIYQTAATTYEDGGKSYTYKPRMYISGNTTFDNCRGEKAGAILIEDGGYENYITETNGGQIVFKNCYSEGSGGALRVGATENGTHIYGNIVFQNNRAWGKGGAIYGSNMWIGRQGTSRVTIKDNSARTYGGGIAAIDKVYLGRVDVTGNTAGRDQDYDIAYNSYTSGGGIYTEGLFAVTSTTNISNNKSIGYGGGIYVTSTGTLQIEYMPYIDGNTNTNNEASDIYLSHNADSGASAKIKIINSLYKTADSGTMAVPIGLRVGKTGTAITTGWANAAQAISDVFVSEVSGKALYVNDSNELYVDTGYLVTIDPNDGATTGTSGYTASITWADTASYRPSRTGYTFKGWTTKKDDASTLVLSANNTTYTPTANVTLYGLWEAKTYSITYNLNGGSVQGWTPGYFVATYGESYMLVPSTTPTRPGYTFGGWRLSYDNGTETIILPDKYIGAKIPFDITLSNSYMIWAVWTERTVSSIKITYRENTLQSYFVDDALKSFTITVTYDNSETAKVTVTESMVSNFSTATTTGAKTATITYGGKTATFTYTVSAGYAYKVEHYQENADDDEYTLVSADTQTLYGVGTTEATAKTYEGFTAQSFSQVSINENGTTVVKIYYDRNVYTITFNMQGGNGGTTEVTVKHGQTSFSGLVPPTKAGYTFNGYYTQMNGGGKRWFDEDMAEEVPDTTANATVYAYWTERMVERIEIPAASQNQSYVAGDAFVPFNITVTYDNGETETVQVTTSMLDNFSTESAVASATATVSYGGKEATFTYTVAAKKYNLTYNVNGATGTGPLNQEVAEGASVTLPFADGLTKAGYTFGGWSDGTNTYEAGANYTISSADVSFTAIWKLKAPTITIEGVEPLEGDNKAEYKLAFTYDGNAHNVTLHASHELGDAVTYTYYMIMDGDAQVNLNPDNLRIPPWHMIESDTYGFVDADESAYYSFTVTVTDGNDTAVAYFRIKVAIGKADQTITLSENEFTYSEGLTIDFADYVDGTGDGTLSFEVSDKNGVAFDFANGVISNITKAGGTFTLTVNKAASDNYNVATETFTVTLNKGAQTLSVSGTPSAPTWKQNFTVSVSGNKGALSYAITSGNATINSSGVITANGAGQVRYSVTAAATDLYEAKTQEFSVTFSKAAGNLAPDYELPTGITICIGHTSDDITLPTGWRFQSKTTLGQVGNVTLTAVFTPSDTANYSAYTENFTIAVTNHTGGTAASCTTAQVCTECGDVLVEALGHNYNEQVDNTVRTTAANCQECNTYWYDCSRCGQSAKNDANATDKWYTSNEAGEHNMSSDWTSENGQHFHKCTVNGCTHTEDTEDCDGGRATCQTKATCDTCGASYGSLGDHSYNYGSWGYSDADGHAYKCIYCDAHTALEEHDPNAEAATEHEAKYCTYCGYVIEQKLNHVHSEGTAWEYDSEYHWHDCVGNDDQVYSKAEHTYDNACDTTCNVCNAMRTITHDYSKLEKNDTEHWYVCSVCGSEKANSRVSHSGGVATCQELASCLTCTQAYGELGTHSFDTSAWGYKDSNGHAYVCTVNGCTAHDTITEHISDIAEATVLRPKKCVACDYVINSALGFASDNIIYKIVTNEIGNYTVEVYDNNLTKATDVTIPATVISEGIEYLVVSIGENAFRNNGYITGVYISDGVISIAKSAFESCSELKYANLPESIETLGIGVFCNCARLSYVNIPSNVKVIEEWTFNGCHVLEGITIPDGVTHIGYRAFYNCYTLPSVVIPYSVETLGKNAFYGCTGLEKMRIYSMKVAIGENAIPTDIPVVYCEGAESTAAKYCAENGISFQTHEGEHVDKDKNHICDYGCSEALGVCEDNNFDHNCDYGCEKTYSEHSDGDDNNHLCDYGCQKIADDGCYDTVVDGKCDECGENIIHDCKDDNKNHECDICGTAIGNHSDSITDKDHLCDYGCGAVMENCVPNADDGDCTTDIICSICGAITTEGAASHIGGNATCTEKAVCSTCHQAYGNIGDHSYDMSAWGYKGTDGHAHVCTVKGCNEHDEIKAHTPNIPAATEESAQYCTTCQYQMAAQLNHTHSPATEWTSNATHHWKACGGCDEHLEEAPHSYDPNNACDTTCEVCNAVREVSHDFTGEWEKDASGHWHVCTKNGCSVTDTKQNHVSAGAATETDPEVCSICGWQIAPALGHTTHTPEAEWQKNETHHWHECAGCDGQELDKAAHNDGNNDGACDTCGYAMSVTPPPHTHAHGSTWVTDANEHWNECECGDKANKAAHVDDNGDNKCDTCDYTMPAHDPDPQPHVDNPPTDDNDGLGTGAIIGIVVAAVAVVGGGGFAIFWFVIRKKRR